MRANTEYQEIFDLLIALLVAVSNSDALNECSGGRLNECSGGRISRTWDSSQLCSECGGMFAICMRSKREFLSERTLLRLLYAFLARAIALLRQEVASQSFSPGKLNKANSKPWKHLIVTRM